MTDTPDISAALETVRMTLRDASTSPARQRPAVAALSTIEEHIRVMEADTRHNILAAAKAEAERDEAVSARREIPSDDLAYAMGDTFIHFEDMPPTQQWARISRMLAESGYAIVARLSTPKEPETP